MKEKIEAACAIMTVGALLAIGAKMANIVMDDIDYLINEIPNKKSKKKGS